MVARPDSILIKNQDQRLLLLLKAALFACLMGLKEFSIKLEAWLSCRLDNFPPPDGGPD